MAPILLVDAVDTRWTMAVVAPGGLGPGCSRWRSRSRRERQAGQL